MSKIVELAEIWNRHFSTRLRLTWVQNEQKMSSFAEQAEATPPHLLLIDDDLSLAALIREYCYSKGLEVTPAATGEEGICLSQQRRFQLIILDVMLPRMDGFEVLKRLRQRSNIPVLMLTTRRATRDRVQGLESGADDYLPKPFEPEELVARIRSILRRVYPAPKEARIFLGDLMLNEMERSVTVGDASIELTGAEFQLLRLLLDTPGLPRSREDLVPQIFGREVRGFDRSIDNLVSSLRKKLGAHPNGSERIKGVRNVGYAYVTEKATR
jgi:two-component system, OmpR family, response regulator CpxR